MAPVTHCTESPPSPSPLPHNPETTHMWLTAMATCLRMSALHTNQPRIHSRTLELTA